MKVLSESWPDKYDPYKQSTDKKYRLSKIWYWYTSQRLGELRNEILDQSVKADMQPPLTRQDIRLGKRQEEITEALGEYGALCLRAHTQTSEMNRRAMEDLRYRANALAAMTPQAEEECYSQGTSDV